MLHATGSANEFGHQLHCRTPLSGAAWRAVSPHGWYPVYSEIVAEPRDIVVIGGSAGAGGAPSGLGAPLPAALHAAGVVVVPTLPMGGGMLPAIPSRKRAL